MLYHYVVECVVSYTVWNEFEFVTIPIVMYNALRFMFPLCLLVFLIYVLGYCVLTVSFLGFKFTGGLKLHFTSIYNFELAICLSSRTRF